MNIIEMQIKINELYTSQLINTEEMNSKSNNTLSW